MQDTVAISSKYFLNILEIYFYTVLYTVFELSDKHHFFNLLEKTQEFVPQFLKQVVNLSCFRSEHNHQTFSKWAKQIQWESEIGPL